MVGLMKTAPLTVRRCPEPVHQMLKKSARVNHRSLNGETLAWLEKQAESKPVSCAETARILRQLDKQLSPDDRRKWVAGIEAARRKMAHERLY